MTRNSNPQNQAQHFRNLITATLDNAEANGHGHFVGKSSGHNLPSSHAHLQRGEYIPRGALGLAASRVDTRNTTKDYGPGDVGYGSRGGFTGSGMSSPDSTDCFGSCASSDFSGKPPDLNVSTILVESKGDLLLVEWKVALSHTPPHTFSLRKNRVSSTGRCRDPTKLGSIVPLENPERTEPSRFILFPEIILRCLLLSPHFSPPCVQLPVRVLISTSKIWPYGTKSTYFAGQQRNGRS